MNTTKSKTSFRDMPLNAELRAAFERQKEIGYTCDKEIDGFTGFIFGNRFHGPHHQNTLNRALKRIVETANDEGDAVLLPTFSMHKLRKTYATNMVRAEADVPRLMKLMGHNDPETTLKIYVDAQADIAAEQDAKMIEMLRANK